MQIKIQKTTLISPSSPPFDHDHTLPLSHIDNDRNLHIYIRYIRVYTATATSPPDPLHVITESLSKALVPYYPLTGTLRPSRDSRLELFCSAGAAAAVPLIYATANQTLASVNHLDSTDQWTEQLVPDPNPSGSGPVPHPFILQLTVFPCGGFTLGACVHHSMCDGVGSTQFFAAMGEFARGAGRASVEPVWDRASLLGARDPPRVEVDLGGVLGVDKEFVMYSEEGVARECFEVRGELVEGFRGRLEEESGVRFSTFETLGAYIWRARVKASKVPKDVKVKFAYSMNIRKLLNPPLPTGYWGNGCVPMYAQTTAKDLVEQPLWKTAELIKKTKRDATDEYVRSFIDFQELHYAEGITAGKEVSGFTDWRHLSHSAVDFGWGGPVTVLPLSRNLLGSSNSCFFLPYSSVNKERKDGFKVFVSLPEMALPVFKVDMEIFSSKTGNLSSLM